MVSTGQNDKTTRYASSQLASGLERNHLIVPRMHDKRRRLHFGEQIDDIEIVDDLEIANGALGRCRFPLQLVEIIGLLMR